MKTCLFVASLIALLFNSCGSESASACANKFEPVITLTNTDAVYTVFAAPNCDAHFNVKGSVAPVTGETGQVDAVVKIKGSDCTVLSVNGFNADKVIVNKEPSGACKVRVPLMWVTAVGNEPLKNQPNEVSLNAELLFAKDPTQARCHYKGPMAGTNVNQPFSVNKTCNQLGT